MITISVAVVISLILVYVMLVAYDAKHETKNAPRMDMYVCDKHGAFPSKYCYTLEQDLQYETSEGIGKKGPILYCPMCFEDRMKEAQVSAGKPQ